MGASWSSTRRTSPPTVFSDTVIPAHYWDNTFPGRSVVIYDLFRFDGVLDAEKLKDSLEKLLDRHGWCKLGARIRLNETGNLDYHVPAYFNEKRVPFAFNHEILDISINEHPRASRFRAAPNVSVPRVQCREEDWEDFMFTPGDPRLLEDYLYSDRPILGFRMITFTDATLLTMSWPHMIFDAMGNSAFLRAWSLVINGREDEVPEFHGADSDPLATLGLRPTEKFMHADKQIGIRQMIILGLRYVCHMLRNPKSEESGRTIFVPAAYIQHLRENARSELKVLGTDSQVPFISEGDILTAWWAQQLARAQLKPSNRQVALYNVFGLRGRLDQDLLPPDRAYVGNAFCPVPTFMTARDILIKPLGSVAAAIRRAYMDLSAGDQVEALLGLSRKAQDKGGAALFGDPWMHMIVCSNWTKADLFNIDFSGALTQCPREGAVGAGKPSFIQGHFFLRGFTILSCFIVMGKDAEGNVWLYSYLQERDWVTINKMLEDTVNR